MAHRRGDDAQARALYTEAPSLYRAIGDWPGIAACLVGIAEAAARQDRADAAARLLGAAAALRDAHALADVGAEGDAAEVGQRGRDAGPVANLLRDPEVLVEEDPRAVVVALVEGDPTEVVEGPGDGALVAEGLDDLQALLVQGDGLIVVALAVGENPGAVQGLGPGRGPGWIGREPQEAVKLRSAFREMTAQPPKPPEGGPQAEGERGLAVLAEPVEGGAQVGVVPVEPIEPAGLVRPLQVRLGLFG